jgi:hypothetical protein
VASPSSKRKKQKSKKPKRSKKAKKSKKKDKKKRREKKKAQKTKKRSQWSSDSSSSYDSSSDSSDTESSSSDYDSSGEGGGDVDPWRLPFFVEKNGFRGIKTSNEGKGLVVGLRAKKELPPNATITFELKSNSQISAEGPNAVRLAQVELPLYLPSFLLSLFSFLLSPFSILSLS